MALRRAGPPLRPASQNANSGRLAGFRGGVTKMANHPNRKIAYPDRYWADSLRARGLDARLLWEMRGPSDTQIAWLSCYIIYGQLDEDQRRPLRGMAIIETMSDGGVVPFAEPHLAGDVVPLAEPN